MLVGDETRALNERGWKRYRYIYILDHFETQKNRREQ